MNNIAGEISVIFLAIVGVAMVAVLVAGKAQTVGVINAFGKAFSDALNAATGPVR